jgi:hypothetical protein
MRELTLLPMRADCYSAAHDPFGAEEVRSDCVIILETDGEHFSKRCAAAICTHEAWAREQGYGYVRQTLWFENSDYSDHVRDSWSKILDAQYIDAISQRSQLCLAMLAYVASLGAEERVWLFVIETDSFVTDLRRSLSDIIATYSSYEMILPHHHFGPLGALPVIDDKDSVLGYYRPTFADNAILLRHSPNTIRLFERWVSMHRVISQKRCGGLGGLVLNEALLHEMARLDGAPAYHSECSSSCTPSVNSYNGPFTCIAGWFATFKKAGFDHHECLPWLRLQGPQPPAHAQEPFLIWDWTVNYLWVEILPPSRHRVPLEPFIVKHSMACFGSMNDDLRRPNLLESQLGLARLRKERGDPGLSLLDLDVGDIRDIYQSNLNMTAECAGLYVDLLSRYQQGEMLLVHTSNRNYEPALDVFFTRSARRMCGMHVGVPSDVDLSAD